MKKPSINRRHWAIRMAVPLALLLVAGCSATGGGAMSPEADKAALLKRAQAYWALVRSNDNVAAWAYEEASKDPKATLEEYLKRGGVLYDSVEVLEVASLEEDRAKVRVRMRYSLPLIRVKGQEATFDDEWRRIDGVWHHVLRRSVMFTNPSK